MHKILVLVILTSLFQAALCNQQVKSTARRSLRPGILELHILADKSTLDHIIEEDLIAGFRAGGPVNPSEGYRWFPVRRPGSVSGNPKLVVESRNNRTHVLALTSPSASLDHRINFLVTHFEKVEKKPPFGWMINMEFNNEGAAQLKKITGENVLSSMGIFLHDEMVTNASIRESISRGVLSISGAPDDIEATYQELLKNSIESIDH